jgi:hypothetical protein
MTPKEMLESFGGELVRGRARIRKDGEIVTIATYVDGVLTLTDEGTKISEAEKASKPKAKPKAKAEPKVEKAEEPVEAKDEVVLADLFDTIEE